MSITKRVLKSYAYIKSIMDKKSFKAVFISVSAFVLFLGVFNVYAQEIEVDWEGAEATPNILNGVDPDEKNTNSSAYLDFTTSTATALQILAPEVFKNADELESYNISEDSKKGLLGVTKSAADNVYANFPLVNVSEHLAQQWVPGHKESVTSTYAANSSTGHPSGYEELMNTGIVSLWNKALNLSYVFFVVVMLGAGFMIMFRHKLGGQTMVTLGNVLPGIVLSLILATFSFAVAGLIIDLGGIATGLVAYIMNGEIHSISNLGQIFVSAFTGNVAGTSITSGAAGIILGGLAALGVGSGGVLLPILGAVGAVGLLIALIIVGVIFVGAIKVLIVLYKAYFSLLLNVILGPIQITLGAFPGNRHVIINWLLSILRNVLVFPVVLFIVNIPNVLVSLDAEMDLNFPGKLVYEDPATYGPGGNVDAAGGLFIFILRIFVLYFAAQAPKFLEAWLPANTSKAVQEGIGAAQANLSKIPLIGGLFK